MNGFFEAPGFRHVSGTLVAAIEGNSSQMALIMGHAERARERIFQAKAFAQDNKNPYDLAYARFWEGLLFVRLREPQRAEAAATQALALWWQSLHILGF